MTTTQAAAAITAIKTFAAARGVTEAELRTAAASVLDDVAWHRQLCMRWNVLTTSKLDQALLDVLRVARAAAGCLAWTVDLLDRGARARLAAEIWAVTGLDRLPTPPTAEQQRDWLRRAQEAARDELAIAHASGCYDAGTRREGIALSKRYSNMRHRALVGKAA